MSARLSFRNVSAALGGSTVLHGATASFDANGLVALVGPNGAGKTTLLKSLVGLVRSTGEIAFDGASAEALSTRERALRVGYLPQGHAIHWPLPGRDVVALGRYARGSHDPSRLSEDDRRAVDAAMAATGTSEFADRAVTELSGGERARIALARVLAAETPIVLADEPITSLDPHYQITVMTLLKRIADDGRLVIVVLHDLALAWRFADRVLALHDGRIAADGEPHAALSADLLARVFGVNAAIVAHEGRSILATLDAI